MPSNPDITALLQRHGQGDEAASEELLRMLYGDLHRVAGALMREQPRDHTLQPTALVHEAYLRLSGRSQRSSEWRDREQFLALAARAMRSALVDHARARKSAKRGGGAARQPLDGLLVLIEQDSFDLVELDDALACLAQESERAARIVELRFFGGLTAEETASTLDTSLRTVERDWRVARAWLAERLSESDADGRS